jgi:hypothetical protein
MAQINANEILIFGGEDLKKFQDSKLTFIAKVLPDSNDLLLQDGPSLPERVLPESPGYNLNSYANFYFLGNISTIFRFNKHDRSWFKIVFEQKVFD